MSQTPKTPAKRVPKASKAQLDAVKRSAEALGEVLDKEQEESVLNLAQALDEINEGEALAHLDTRLAFIERQVERLAARRDEADRGMAGEFEVMRARLEDALNALGSTAAEHRDATLGLEKRLMGLVSEAETRYSESVDTLRSDLVSIVHDATAKFDKTESHLRGELSALEDGVEERTRSTASEAQRLASMTSQLEAKARELDEKAVSRSVEFEDKAKQLEERVFSKASELEEHISSRSAELEANLSSRSAELEANLSSKTSKLEATLSSKTAELESRVASKVSELEARADSKVAAIEETLRSSVETLTAQSVEAVDEQLTDHKTEIEARLLASTSSMKSSIATLQERLDGMFDSERREIQARISESQADVRIDLHKTREMLEEKLTSFAEAIDLLRTDIFSRIKSSEDKAAGAAVHLESTIARGEAEWGSALHDFTSELSDMKIKVEELAGKVGSVEARRATETGASQVALDTLASRVEALDVRFRQMVEDALAKQATRIEVLASQVGAMSEAGSAEEERSGAVSYVSRKVAEMGQRIDEMSGRLTAVGNAIATQTGRMPETVEVLPPELDERIAMLEQRLAVLANQPRQDAVAQGLQTRIDAIERRLSQAPAAPGASEDLVSRIATVERVLSGLAARPQSDSAAGLVERLNAIERTLTNLPATMSSRQAELTQRVEELERRSASASNILPDKRRRGIWPAS